MHLPRQKSRRLLWRPWQARHLRPPSRPRQPLRQQLEHSSSRDRAQAMLIVLRAVVDSTRGSVLVRSWRRRSMVVVASGMLSRIALQLRSLDSMGLSLDRGGNLLWVMVFAPSKAISRRRRCEARTQNACFKSVNTFSVLGFGIEGYLESGNEEVLALRYID